MPRFFIPPDAVDHETETVILTGDNAHHMAYSLRMKPGDRVYLCDQTTDYTCELTGFAGDSVTARILSQAPVSNEPPFVAHLFQALPKGDKLDTVIQKAVECGVSSVTPFESSRCIVRQKPEAEARKTERRCRIAEEAAKQCGRGIIPPVYPTVSFADLPRLCHQADLVLFCYEGEGTLPLPAALRRLSSVADGRRPTIAVIIGSEGGFSPEEAMAAGTAGFVPVGLGKRILRTETASGFVLACLSYALELGGAE